MAPQALADLAERCLLTEGFHEHCEVQLARMLTVTAGDEHVMAVVVADPLVIAAPLLLARVSAHGAIVANGVRGRPTKHFLNLWKVPISKRRGGLFLMNLKTTLFMLPARCCCFVTDVP